MELNLDMEFVTLPINIEAERMLLGVLLADSKKFHMIGGYLRADHFSDELHQRIYDLIADRALNGEQVNVCLLREAFRDDNERLYLGELISLATTIISVTAYADSLVALAKKRKVIRLCQECLFDASQSTMAVEDIESNMIAGINAVISDTPSNAFSSDIQVSDRILASLDAPKKTYSTGLWRLDSSMMGGLHTKRMYTFGARMKTGKTMFAGTIAYNLAEQGVKTLFITAEMDDEEIARRLLCRKLGMESKDFNADVCDPINRQQVIAAAKSTQGNLIYNYEPSITFEHLKQRLHHAVHALGIKGFIMDQWQLVTGKQRQDSEAAHLSEVAQWLSGFCKKEDVFGIVLCQLNQEGNTLGSEGIKRATDQLYTLNKCTDLNRHYYLRMELSRYTESMDIGSDGVPGLVLNPHGPYFEEI